MSNTTTTINSTNPLMTGSGGVKANNTLKLPPCDTPDTDAPVASSVSSEVAKGFAKLTALRGAQVAHLVERV